MPSAPDCEANAIPPWTGEREANVALRRDVGCGVDHAEAIRPDHAHAAAVGAQEQLALHRHAVAADLREARGDHHQPFDALASTGIDGVDALRGRNGEDRQINGTLDRFDAPVRR